MNIPSRRTCLSTPIIKPRLLTGVFVIRERAMVPSVVSTLVTLHFNITAETFYPDFSATTTGHILQMTARTVFRMID